MDIQTVLVADSISSPVAITHSGDESGRLFIVLQAGQILIHNGTQLLMTPFLDISNLVTCCGERGLFSVAFHPNYSSNGFFYVHYTDTSGNTVIARYTRSADPLIADVNSAQIILTETQPFTNHNGGQINFGPDGFLYIALGDGGSGGDPDNRAQNLNNRLGKILRINVDGGSPFTIPPSNPFVGMANVQEEIWVYGLRNPWRFTFDRQTGDMFIGDVGQNSFEEISFQSAGSSGGENYGWRLMEGNACYNPPSNCNDGSLTLPILEYVNGADCAVTGGYRYRGSRFPQMQGIYFYADFCSGKIWGAEETSPGVWTSRLLLDSTFNIGSFGEDENGELYIAHTNGNGGFYRIEDTGLNLHRSGSANAVISPYWQANSGMYTFIAVSHPSLTGMNSQIGVAVHAALDNSLLTYGPSAEFTVEANESHLLFIVPDNHPILNPNQNPHASFITGTSGLSFGQVIAEPVASNPANLSGLPHSAGRGFPSVQQLNFWGAIVIESNVTGFAMEFIGDNQDSRAFNTPYFSGLN